jgi:hypothetical protein
VLIDSFWIVTTILVHSYAPTKAVDGMTQIKKIIRNNTEKLFKKEKYNDLK